jgi:esterase/lipase superfamily enzyme/TRAP-type C4-dicarboxylate transport system substrate-binding protein
MKSIARSTSRVITDAVASVAVRAFLLFALLVPLNAAAQDAVLRIAVDEAQNAVTERLIERFKTRVLETVEGGLRIDLHRQARPGEHTLAAVRNGQIEMALLPLQLFIAGDAEALVHPWQIQNVRDARAAQKSEVGARVMTRIEAAHSVLGVAFLTTGFTRLATVNRPIVEANDLKGLKIRTGAVQSNQASLVIAAQGAVPVQTAFGELKSALVMGAIDGVIVPSDERVVSLQLGDTLRHVVEQPYQPIVHVLVVNKQFWRDLNYRAQDALSSVAEEIADEVGPLIAEQEGRLNVYLAEFGSSLKQITDATLSDFRSASAASWMARQERGAADYLDRVLAHVSLAKAPHTFAVEAPPLRARGNHVIYFATNRAFEHNTSLKLAFGSTPEAGRNVHLGRVTVTLAPERKLDSDPDRIAKLSDFEVMEEPASFHDAIRGHVQASKSKTAVVFVHGYNNKFHQALQRAATLREDSAPDATVIAYSWPSDGALLSYAYDEDMVRSTVLSFQGFMTSMENALGRNAISIVAHSMGSRVVIDYLRLLIAQSQSAPRFKAIVLAAADVQLTELGQIRNEVKGLTERVTVYSSAHDAALWLSEDIHRTTRLGRTSPSTMFLEPDIDTIDASDIDRRWFATRHGYVFDRRAGVVDLKAVIAGEPVDARPGLERLARGPMYFWKLKE